MGLFDFLKKERKPKINKDEYLSQALAFSRRGDHAAASLMYEVLYNDEKSAINAFNLLLNSVYCGNNKLEQELFDQLKSYKPNLTLEPVELNGPFVRLYYSLALCESNRNKEAIPHLEFLMDLINKESNTSSKVLHQKGIPHVGMIRDLVNKVFNKDGKKLVAYKQKILTVVDEESKQELLEHYE